MSEEFEIESFEDLIDVFENTGDFGKYYLGDYSNIQIANYLRKMQQENKQLKNILIELEEWLNSKYKKGKELLCDDIRMKTVLDKIQDKGEV